MIFLVLSPIEFPTFDIPSPNPYKAVPVASHAATVNSFPFIKTEKQ